jgi:hypothetical protein
MYNTRPVAEHTPLLLGEHHTYVRTLPGKGHYNVSKTRGAKIAMEDLPRAQVEELSPQQAGEAQGGELLQTRATLVGTGQVFDSLSNIMKTKHETVKNTLL